MKIIRIIIEEDLLEDNKVARFERILNWKEYVTANHPGEFLVEEINEANRRLEEYQRKHASDA